MKKRTGQFFDCYECGAKESVLIVTEDFGETKIVSIKKCSSCKRQHTLKQFFKNMTREQSPESCHCANTNDRRSVPPVGNDKQ